MNECMNECVDKGHVCLSEWPSRNSISDLTVSRIFIKFYVGDLYKKLSYKRKFEKIGLGDVNEFFPVHCTVIYQL
jgi:hypothetical protein